MKSISNFGKTIALPASLILAAFLPAQAQNPVESTHIDKKYAYTTVVYKSVAASDKDVLSALESDFSIGDVVRVTLAPPPSESLTAISASEPVYADKSKGEDAWLQKSASNMEFSNISSQTPKTVSGTIPVAPRPIPNPMSNLAPNQLPKTVAATPQKQSSVVEPKVAQTQPSALGQVAPEQQEKVKSILAAIKAKWDELMEKSKDGAVQ